MRSTITLLTVLLISMSIHAQDAEIEVQLLEGLNYISINVFPPANMWIEGREGPDIPRMFEQAWDDEFGSSVALIEDEFGRIYSPAFNFNQIPFWNLQRGLYVQMYEPFQFVWEGELMEADELITFGGTQVLLPYFPNYQLNANNEEFFVIADFIDVVTSVTDGRGEFIIPEYNFSNMNPWQPGKAYAVQLDLEEDEQIEFRYPEEQDADLVFFDSGDHWELPAVPSRYNMQLLITEIVGLNGFNPDDEPQGDQVAVFTEDDVLTGLGDVHDGMCGVIIIGHDDVREDNQFIELGDEYTLRYWDESEEVLYDVQLWDVMAGEGLVYSNTRSVVELLVGNDNPIVHSLMQGWNLISLNVIPVDDYWVNDLGPDVRLMTEQLMDDEDHHHLILMKNDRGQFYSPENDFNNIQFWHPEKGYALKVDVEIEADWIGEQINADADIHLDAGWNMIAYYPNYELPARSPNFYVLSPIIEHVIVAKDGQGRFMTPEFEFSDMPPWRLTQGYKVKVDEDVVLNYPDPFEMDVIRFNGNLEIKATIRSTGSNMSLLVLGLHSSTGSIVKALNSEGLIVGQGIVNIDGKCGLAIWGDDPTTPAKDGLADGEAFTLFLDENVIEPSVFLAGNNLSYEIDGLVVIEAEAQASVPAEYFTSEAYPNPFNNRTVINYGLPESGQVKIDLYDISGRHINSLGKFDNSAGIHSFKFDGTGMNSGIYLIQIDVNNIVSTSKIILIK